MPYYEQPYDNRASMARLSDLARMRANVLSDAEQRAAMARAAMVSGIGQIVGGTLADLATYQTGERARKKAEGEAAARKDTLRMTSALPAEQQAGELRAAGYLEDADRAEARAEHLSDRKDRKEQSELAAMRARIDQTKTLFGRGAALLSEAERAPERWGEIRPMVIDLAAQVSPDLVDFVPQTPEPGAIRELVTSVQTAAADYAKTAAALKGIESALKKTKDMAEATKHVGTILSATTTPEQWDGIQGLLAKEGVPSEILSAFGGFSPENVQRALAISTGKAGGTSADGSFTLTPGAKRFNASGKVIAEVPRAPGSDDQMPSGASRAAAERWKQDALASAEKDFRAAFTEARDLAAMAAEEAAAANPKPGAQQKADMAAAKVKDILDAHEQRKKQIQASYLTQLNLPASNLVPGAQRASAQVPAPPPPGPGRPAPSSPLGSGTATAAPGPVPIPPDLERMLREQGPGEYDLEDGTSYRVDAGGRVTRVK